MDLFDEPAPTAPAGLPLAVRMRPRTAEEVVGQDHLLAPGSPLRRLIDATETSVSSIILWGPPGTGKTSLAGLIASGGRRFVEVSAVTAGVKELRAAVDAARDRLARHGSGTVLFVDEVHRFSRTQQDALLPSVENGWVTLVAATTENPSFSVVGPLLSRSLVLALRSVPDEAVAQVVRRAVDDPRGLGGALQIDDDAVGTLLRLAGGDVRRALTLLEAAAGQTSADGRETVTDTDVSTAGDATLVRYDRAGDQHYDVTSAFIKSMRGSDPDAALHYLARMVAAGEDPRFIARRIMIAAAEDVGLADPSALQTAVAAAQAVALVGMPEARIILAEAVVHVATAPKSNAAHRGLEQALADIAAGRIGEVPRHLRDGHGPGGPTGYRSAHDAPHAVAAMQYLPDALTGRRYYEPSDRGYERQVGERLVRIRQILGGA